MDDVKADATGQFIRYYELEFGISIQRDDLNFQEELAGFPPHHQEAIYQYTSRKDFFRTMEVKAHCQEVMKALNDRYELFIVSAAVEFPNSLTEKIDWLHEHFSFLHWKQMVFCGSKAVVHGDYMIDDMAYNLDTFNGEKFLYTAPHNLQHMAYNRLNDWLEIKDKLLA